MKSFNVIAPTAVDVSAVRLALSFIDITLHAWKPSALNMAKLMAGAQELYIDPRLYDILRGAGPGTSGAALVQDAGGIDSLEQVCFLFLRYRPYFLCLLYTFLLFNVKES